MPNDGKSSQLVMWTNGGWYTIIHVYACPVFETDHTKEVPSQCF